LVKGCDFKCWLIANGDAWVEIQSAFFERGLCIIDLSEAVELLGIVTVAVERLREEAKP